MNNKIKSIQKKNKYLGKYIIERLKLFEKSISN